MSRMRNTAFYPPRILYPGVKKAPDPDTEIIMIRIRDSVPFWSPGSGIRNRFFTDLGSLFPNPYPREPSATLGSIADPGCLSRILTPTLPGSRIPDAKTATKEGQKKPVVTPFPEPQIPQNWKPSQSRNAEEKNFGQFSKNYRTQKTVTNLPKIWVWNPGSKIPHPEKTHFGSRIRGSFFKDKKSQRSQTTVGIKVFCLMIEPYLWLTDPGGPKTYGRFWFRFFCPLLDCLAPGRSRNNLAKVSTTCYNCRLSNFLSYPIGSKTKLCPTFLLLTFSSAFLTLGPGSRIGLFRIPDLGSRILNRLELIVTPNGCCAASYSTPKNKSIELRLSRSKCLLFFKLEIGPPMTRAFFLSTEAMK